MFVCKLSHSIKLNYRTIFITTEIICNAYFSFSGRSVSRALMNVRAFSAMKMITNYTNLKSLSQKPVRKERKFTELKQLLKLPSIMACTNCSWKTCVHSI